MNNPLELKLTAVIKRKPRLGPEQEGAKTLTVEMACLLHEKLAALLPLPLQQLFQGLRLLVRSLVDELGGARLGTGGAGARFRLQEHKAAFEH